MNRFWLLLSVAAMAMTSSVAMGQVIDPALFLLDYRFVPSKTNVHVTGGPNDYNMNLAISGSFGLLSGYDGSSSGHISDPNAKFVDVHGILYNPLSAAPLPVPGWDLDQTLNMSGWKGTFAATDLLRIYFLGADGAGVAMRVQAVLNGPWLQLLGGSSDPMGPDPVLYQINALAHRVPFADFNNDGAVTTADLSAMQQALADPQAYEAAHYLSADDFTALADVNGDGVVNGGDLQALLLQLRSGSGASDPVPEPSALVLLALGGFWVLCRAAPCRHGG